MAIKKKKKVNVIISEKQYKTGKLRHARYGCTSLCHMMRVALDYYMESFKNLETIEEKSVIFELIDKNHIPKNYVGRRRKKEWKDV